MVYIAKQITIMALFVLYQQSTYSQIPHDGADFPSLGSLHWGMTVGEAEGNLKKELRIVSDTMAVYSDSFFASKVLVTLAFSDPSGNHGLQSITVQSEDSSLGDSLTFYLRKRYGEKFAHQMTEQTKFFITFQLESMRWSLKGEDVVMIRMLRNNQVIGFSLLYRSADNGHQKIHKQ